MAKDSFSVIDAKLAEVQASVKTDAARRLHEGAEIASARDGAVVVVTAHGKGKISRVVKRYKKVSAPTAGRMRQKEATSA